MRELTPEVRAEIAQRAEAVTGASWDREDVRLGTRADREFAATARTDVPALLAHIATVERRAVEAEAAVETFRRRMEHAIGLCATAKRDAAQFGTEGVVGPMLQMRASLADSVIDVLGDLYADGEPDAGGER